MFYGKQVVKPEELEPDEPQAVSTGDRTGSGNVKAIVDKVRIWKGKKLHILAVENQNYVDYQMVLRTMLSESVGYRKQWKRQIMGWARCLYDLLEVEDELKAYVTNYRLNLYDCHEHDTFGEYKTGLRQVFEAVRYAEDKKKLKEVMEENHEAYSRIDSDTRNMLEVVANIKIPEECKVIGEDGRYDMYKAFEDMRQEGYDEGIEKGIRALIQTCVELGISNDVIIEKCAEKYELTEKHAREYVAVYCI